MKTLVVMTGRNRFGNFAFNFHADVVREHEIFSRSLSQLRDREGWREYSNRRLREETVNAILCRGKLRIVEIVSVNRDSVGKCREPRVRLHPSADDAGLHIAQAKRLHVLTHERRHRGTGTRKRQSKTVQNGLLAQIDYVSRNVLIPRVDDEFRNVLLKSSPFRTFLARDTQ